MVFGIGILELMLCGKLVCGNHGFGETGLWHRDSVIVVLGNRDLTDRDLGNRDFVARDF
jgi:hypothetical protein